MTFKRMQQLQLKGKRVLIREDFNVALSGDEIDNDTRIRAALPTIEMAVSMGAHVILMSHLGRPAEGKLISEQAQYSLQPVAARLSELLRTRVNLVQDYLGVVPTTAAAGHISLLENVRINAGEKANDDGLSKQYAALCDVFVMDAFGAAHRAQSSTCGVAKFAPLACAGPLLVRELDALDRFLKAPQKPMLAIVGGAKVSSKLGVLENLATKVDQLIVGGGIANTFLAATGINVGNSLYEPELVEVAAALLESTNIPLPTDVIVAKELSGSAPASTKLVAELEDDDMILDIGPVTAMNFAEIVGTMKTILWNGPLGVFEYDQFAQGTRVLAQAIADNPGFSIAGGGETVAAIDKFSVTEAISYISTGGGAFLDYVQGAVLPAVQILEDRASKN